MLSVIRIILYYLFKVLDLVLLIYCVFSWFIRDPNNKIYRFLCSVCDPILNPIRALLSKVSFLQNSPIDFSPVALMLLFSLLLKII